MKAAAILRSTKDLLSFVERTLLALHSPGIEDESNFSSSLSEAQLGLETK